MADILIRLHWLRGDFDLDVALQLPGQGISALFGVKRHRRNIRKPILLISVSCWVFKPYYNAAHISYPVVNANESQLPVLYYWHRRFY